jgi:glycosyltransferase involved in cell wall biosynthesis
MKPKIAIFIPEVTKDVRRGYQRIFLADLDILQLYFEIDIYTHTCTENIPSAINKFNIIKIPSNFFLTIIGFIYSLIKFRSFRAASSIGIFLPNVWHYLKNANYHKFVFYTPRMAYFLNKGILSKSIIVSIDPYPIFIRNLSQGSQNLFIRFFGKIEFFTGLAGDKYLISNVQWFTLINARDVRLYSRFFHTKNIVKSVYSVPDQNYKKIVKKDRTYVTCFGNFNFIPNRIALKNILYELYPFFRKNKKIKLCVAGSGIENFSTLSEFNSVKFISNPDSFESILSKSWVSLSLADIRVGVQSKILESLSVGVPVAVFPSSVKGLAAKLENGFLLIESGNNDELFKELCDLYDDNDKWSFLSTGGLSFIKEFHSVVELQEHWNTLINFNPPKN